MAGARPTNQEDSEITRQPPRVNKVTPAACSEWQKAADESARVSVWARLWRLRSGLWRDAARSIIPHALTSDSLSHINTHMCTRVILSFLSLFCAPGPDNQSPPPRPPRCLNARHPRVSSMVSSNQAGRPGCKLQLHKDTGDATTASAEYHLPVYTEPEPTRWPRPPKGRGKVKLREAT